MFGMICCASTSCPPYLLSIVPLIQLHCSCLCVHPGWMEWGLFLLLPCFLHPFLHHPICPIRYLTAPRPDNPACLELSLHATGATHYLIKTGIHTLHKALLHSVKGHRHPWNDTVKAPVLNRHHAVTACTQLMAKVTSTTVMFVFSAVW